MHSTLLTWLGGWLMTAPPPHTCDGCGLPLVLGATLTAPQAWARLHDWLITKGRSPRTVTAYRLAWADWTTWLARHRHKPWYRAAERDLDLYLHRRVHPGARHAYGPRLTAYTQRAYAKHILRLYRLATRLGLLARNPLEGAEAPRVGRPIPRALDLADVARILDAAARDRWPTRSLLMVVLAYGIGLRCQEIARLRLEDIVLDGDTPRVHVTTVAGKGGRERVIPIGRATWVVESLRTLLTGRPVAGPAVERYDTRAGEPLTPGYVSEELGRVIAAAGVRATAHQLRHTFATMVYRRYRDLPAISELLGHASVDTTRVYTLAGVRLAAEEAMAYLPDPRGGGAGS